MDKCGLVLGGGGTRGAYEVGVWEALKELSINISVIVGTSIGAVNGALFIQSDLETIKKIWLGLDLYKCFSFAKDTNNSDFKLSISYVPSLVKEMVIGNGINFEPFHQLLKECINEKKIRNSNVDFGLVTYSTSNLKPVEVFKEHIPEGKLIDYLLASCCFPGFKQVEIDGEKFIDGGVYNNIPADMILNKDISTIITVNIHGPGNVKKFPKNIKNIIEIECSEELGPIFTFNSGTILRSIKLGYLDTLRRFEKVKGNFYYFYDKKIALTSILAPISESEMEFILDFIDYKNLKKDKILIMRVIRLLSKSTRKIPDGNTSILTALEITAELLNVERCKIYTYEELLNLVMEKALDLHSDEDIFKETFVIKKYIDLVNLDFHAIGSMKKITSMRKVLGLLSPKYLIGNLFLVLIKYRMNTTKY